MDCVSLNLPPNPQYLCLVDKDLDTNEPQKVKKLFNCVLGTTALRQLQRFCLAWVWKLGLFCRGVEKELLIL